MFSSIINWVKGKLPVLEADAAYGKAVAKAAAHGAWSGLSSVIGASILDYSKFNLTNGLRSELDLLIMVSLCSGGLAAYVYVKEHAAPKQ